MTTNLAETYDDAPIGTQTRVPPMEPTDDTESTPESVEEAPIVTTTRVP